VAGSISGLYLRKLRLSGRGTVLPLRRTLSANSIQFGYMDASIRSLFSERLEIPLAVTHRLDAKSR
jgi:hypothetical protein